MALTKKTAPKFESEENTIDVDAVVGVEEISAPSEDVPQAVEAAPHITEQAASTATQVITKASTSSAVSTGLGKKFVGAMIDLEHVFPIDAVRQIGLAAPRITIDTGGFAKDGKDLGKVLIVQVISYNDRYLVSPGIAGDEGKELVRYSLDKHTLEGDEDQPTVQQYLAQLKEEGYSKASLKNYVDLWCVVTGPGTDEAEAVIGETVVIQLSPQSAGQFKFWQLGHGVKISKGLAQPTESLKITVERTKIGSETFGRASFQAA